jgi:hypothetical protein
MAIMLDSADLYALDWLERRIERRKLERERGAEMERVGVPAAVRQEQEKRAKAISTYEFECVCGCPISTRAKDGTCPSCARKFDVSGVVSV